MQLVASANQQEEQPKVFEDAARTQIRGSSLFVVGRFISLGVNFLSQLLLVRYLATAQYGAIAYGLSIVAFCQPFASLGLQDAASRFVPIFHEKREYDKLFGTVLFIAGIAVLSGMALIGAIGSSASPIASLLSHEVIAKALLPIMIFLVPVEALDNLLIALFASFASTNSIFFRRYILGPGLKLSVVIMLLCWHEDILFLAYGFVAATTLGVLLYLGVLVQLFRRFGLFAHFHLRQITVPAREILAFSLPGFTAGFVTVAIYAVNASMLGHLRDMSQVAFYRAVVPLAQLNNVVMTSFALLYIPLASRLFAKADLQGINDLYWRTTVWMMVLSFPIFALTFSTASPITVFLYGERYRESAPILALLALGCYFNVILGFNLQTLKVLKKLRYIVCVSIAAALANFGANLVLIPRYGALGAAVGTAGTLILFNLLLQTGLVLANGLSAFERRYAAVYLAIATGAVGLFAIQRLCSEKIYVAVPLAIVGSLFVFASSKKHLNPAETFPELLRLRFIRALIT